jgi:hypothetical protein
MASPVTRPTSRDGLAAIDAHLAMLVAAAIRVRAARRRGAIVPPPPQRAPASNGNHTSFLRMNHGVIGPL